LYHNIHWHFGFATDTIRRHGRLKLADGMRSMTFTIDKLDVEDVARLLRLLADVGDPLIDLPTLERKRLLISGLAEIIGADIWIWGTGVLSPSPDLPKDAMATCWLDSGWKDEEERVRFLGMLTNPAETELLQGGLIRKVLAQRIVTVDTNGIVDPNRREEALARMAVMNWSDSLVAGYPIGSGAFSALAFHRRKPHPVFTERERLIVHLIVQQVDWLHRYGSNIPANDKVLRLSARQRQVLMQILAGDSQKSIAIKLHLSEHTVNDHIKEIYRRFNVNSRSELFAHFVSGGEA
jgi:DNA-binding CsgD family transcriptional regulator